MDREKHLERIQKLRPIDDEFMRIMFTGHPEIVQEVLRRVTNIEDLIVESFETQKDVKVIDGRSIILDAYCTDSAGKVYNIEIERSSERADPKRARYHSACIDVRNLSAKEDFSQLPESYVIFITEDDYFNEGEAVYVI